MQIKQLLEHLLQFGVGLDVLTALHQSFIAS